MVEACLVGTLVPCFGGRYEYVWYFRYDIFVDSCFSISYFALDRGVVGVGFLLLLVMVYSYRGGPRAFLSLFSGDVDGRVIIRSCIPASSLDVPRTVLSSNSCLIFLRPTLPRLLAFCSYRGGVFSRKLGGKRKQSRTVDIRAVNINGDTKRICTSSLTARSIFLLSFGGGVGGMEGSSVDVSAQFYRITCSGRLTFFLLINSRGHFLVGTGKRCEGVNRGVIVPGVSPRVISRALRNPYAVSDRGGQVT